MVITWGVFGKLDCEYKRFVPCREALILVGKFAKIAITSSSAREWYDDGEKALMHTHLDFNVFDITGGGDSIEGPLPEMWGMKALSHETKSLLTKGDPIEVHPGPTGSMLAHRVMQAVRGLGMQMCDYNNDTNCMTESPI